MTGKWGSGKTSVLRQAFATLGGRPLEQMRSLGEPHSEQGAGSEWDEFSAKQRLLRLGWDASFHDRIEQSLCVWFSPWQQQGEPNPLVPLVREIQTQFEARLPALERMGQQVAKRRRSLGLAAVSLIEHVADAALSLQNGKTMNVARGTSEAVRKAWKEGEDQRTALSDGQRFHLLFEDAVEELLHSLARDDAQVDQHTRLIIFVDDLDRCEESMIVQLLEAIKLYLGSRRCVFVLGLDHGAVMDALKRHWKRSDDSNREYLEKLFQATVAVPLPRPTGVRDAITRQLELHNIPAAAGSNDANPDVDQARVTMASEIERLLEPNPRKLKNFVNSLCSNWAVHGMSGTGDQNEARRFVMFQYLRLYHPRVWRLLERQPITLKLLWYVLNKNTTQTEGVDLEGLDKDDQRLLMQFFSRAFCHVLADDADVYKDEIHRKQDIDKALDAFEDRQDRKRSDETFVALFLGLYPAPPDRLPDDYLYAAESERSR